MKSFLMKFGNNNLTFRKNIANYNSYLFIILGFFLPISISVSTGILLIMLLLWLYEGCFLEKYRIIRNNPISYTFLGFFLIQIIGLLWTSDFKWGLHIISKEWRILLFLMLLTIVKKEHVKYYIFSFILAMSFSELLSYLIFFKISSPFLNATLYDPTPFINHISYNPLLAFCIFILLYLLLLQKNYTNKTEKIISVFFIITMSINMFVTGGRAGQVGYFTMIILISFLYYKKNIFKAVLIIFIIVPSIFLIMYNTSAIFHNRVNLAVTNFQDFKTNPNSSIGLRLAFLKNSIRIIKNNPIIGIGTGDFPKEYTRISKKYTPNIDTVVQPHNMYLLELVQTGMLGLFIMLSIFYMQIKISLQKNKLSPLRLALPILFLVLMFSDSYLLGHYTTLLFVYFSSFLYRNFDNENI